MLMRARHKMLFLLFLNVVIIRETWSSSCVLCEEGSFCFNGNNFTCPTHSASAAGATSVSDCVCVPGYYKDENGQCVMCPENSFCSNNVMTQCGTNQVSNQFSSDITDCLCKEGYTIDTGECVACEPGTYKAIAGDSVCELCPENTFATESGNSAVEDCESCPNGAISSSGSSSVLSCLCPLGSELDVSAPATCVACQPGSYGTVNDESSSSSDEIEGNLKLTNCGMGEYMHNGEIITADSGCCRLEIYHDNQWGSICDNGWDDTDANVACKQLGCDSGGTTFPRFGTGNGFHWLSEVSCTGSESRLTECGSNGWGVHSCYYDPNLPISAEDVGVCCTDVQVTGGLGGTGSCAAPSSPICTLCGAGTYSNTTGLTACTSCGNVSSSTSLGAVSSSSCLCNEGHILSSDVCVPCPPGSYTSDGQTCTLCPPDSFTDSYANSVCTSCPSNSHAPEGSINVHACVCEAGYVLEGIWWSSGPDHPTECHPCPGGYFKAVADNSVGCTACPVGTWNNNRTTCLPCPPNTFQHETGKPYCHYCTKYSTSQEGSVSSTQCYCDPGFGFDASTSSCDACEQGFYKATVDNTQCVACDAGYTTEEQASTSGDCVLCPANHYVNEHGVCLPCGTGMTSLAGADSIDGCKCAPGFTLDSESGSLCVECVIGKYKMTSGNQLCTVCPVGWIGDADSVGVDRVSIDKACIECPTGHYALDLTTCLACIANSNSPAGSDEVEDCLCNAGFTSTGSGATLECVACPAGSYKVEVGPPSCNLCPTNTYQPYLNSSDSSDCLACPLHSISPEGSTGLDACTCVAGYTTGGAGECISCPGGSFKPLDGNHACTLCATGTYYNGNEPYILDKCLSCPDHTQPNQAGVGIDSCFCANGYIEANETCQSCAIGFYCPSITQEIACYAGSTSTAASTSIEDCTCLPGYYKNCTDSVCQNECLICPVNYFCVGGNTQLQQCPTDSTTQTNTGSSNSDLCICNPGWYDVDGECVECNENNYCADNNKLTCPPNSTALTGQGSISKCFCDAYFTRDAGYQCHPCGSHLVCEGAQQSVVNGEIVLSSGSVQECSRISYRGDELLGFGASNYQQKCVCSQGFSCGSGLTNASCVKPESCESCPPDHYCQDNQRIACDENRTSPAESYKQEQCRCKEGYYLAENGRCLACPIGSFCTNQTLTQCSTFDSRLTTHHTTQSLKSECICPLGEFRVFKNDTCKPCPLNFYCPSEKHTYLPNAVTCAKNQYTEFTHSTMPSQCLCDVGFIMSGDSDTFMECIACPPGHRCGAGSVVEFSCHLQNRVANADHSKCVCFPGFEQNADGNCQACPAGYVKPEMGDHECVPCTDTSFYLNSTTCLTCGLHEVTSEDHMSCVCEFPFVRNDGKCQLCNENEYFKDGLCVACPEHSDTRGLLGQSNVTSCQCKTGFYDYDSQIDIVTCASCPVGSYGDNGICLNCGTNAVTLPGSTLKTDCFCNASLCHQFVWGDTCSGSCEIVPTPCDECEPGHVKNFISELGNTDLCQLCEIGKYQDLSGQTSCGHCDATRSTLTTGASSIDDCLCRPGFEEVSNISSDMSCSACLTGHSKSFLGNVECEKCSIGHFAASLQSTACFDCSISSSILNANTTLFIGSTHEDNCTCLKGYMLNSVESKCEECPTGSYKTSPGFHNCRLCGEDIPSDAVHDLDVAYHHFGSDNVSKTFETHCTECPLFSGQDEFEITFANPMDEITDCLCFPAHTLVNGVCEHCSNGEHWTSNYSYKVGYSNSPCELCNPGEYWVQHNSPCVVCELNDAENATRHHRRAVINQVDASMSWGVDFSDCDCDLGHTRVGDTCHPCLEGTFRNDSLDRTCHPCGLDQYQDNKGQSECKSCPPNSYTETIQNTDITQCLCEAGYEWNDQEQTCDECTAGTNKGRGSGTCQVCPENTYSLARSALCTACGPNERSSPGSGSPFSCNCKPGFGSLDGAECSICGNGTFSGGGQESASNNPAQQRPTCQECPSNKNSAQGSTERANCKCIPGYGDPNNNADDGAACSPCQNGFYASGGNNIACFSCGFGAVTEPPQAAFAFDCCQCDASIGLYEA